MATLFIVTVGKFYRNRIGQVVLITDIVEPGTKMYDKGYRFLDQRGTLYTKLGDVQSKLWKGLGLTSVVACQHVTDEEITTIHDQAVKFIAWQNRRDKILKTWDKATPYLLLVEVALATLISIMIARKLDTRTA